jgi:hypothetical protein
MSYSFGTRSTLALESCVEPLQLVAHRAIQIIDFSVLCGHRGREAQDDAFEAGASKLRWPHSIHNRIPSEAFDLAPYPISWAKADEWRFVELAGVVLRAAHDLEIKLDWGFHLWGWDMPHFQLRQN